MTKFEVWKRKQAKRESETISNNEALRLLGDSIRATYPERYTNPSSVVTPFEDMNFVKVTWNKV